MIIKALRFVRQLCVFSGGSESPDWIGLDRTGAERADRAEAKTRHAGKNEFYMKKSEPKAVKQVQPAH